jgi:RNA polymerase sigma-70 factor (ECF subfamily)
MTFDALRGRRPEVLSVLMERHGLEIQNVAFLILRDWARAEDVLADTLLAALDRGNTLRDEAALRRWLLRIAVNKAIDTRRSSSRVVQLHLVPDREGRRSFDDDRIALLGAVGRLAPRMRAALVLRYYADLPVREVAEALGTSENTIKTQLREALAQLREALGEADDFLEDRHG